MAKLAVESVRVRFALGAVNKVDPLVAPLHLAAGSDSRLPIFHESKKRRGNQCFGRSKQLNVQKQAWGLRNADGLCSPAGTVPVRRRLDAESRLHQGANRCIVTGLQRRRIPPLELA